MTGPKANPVHVAYRKMLGEHPGEGAAAFIRNLSWISASFVIAKFVSSLVGIAAGRVLGPGQYGRINVMVSTGAAISPFLLAGLNYSIIRYGTDRAERDRVFTTAAAVFLVLTCLAAAFVVAAGGPLSSFLGVSRGMLLLSMAYAAAMSAFLVVSSMQQASGGFSGRGLSEIAFSLLLAAFFFGGLFYFGRSYKSMALAYIAAFSSLALFWAFRIAKRVRTAFLDGRRFLEMFEYGSYYFGAAIGAFLVMNVQSLIMNFFLTPSEVGVYAAYNAASIGISGYLGYAIGTVLFPKAAASTNRRRLWDFGARIWTFGAAGAVLFFMAAEGGVLALMGRSQYGMDPLLIGLFACCATLMLIYNSMAQIVFSEGVRASRLAMVISLCSGAVNFTACLLLVPRYRVPGAAVAFIATYAFMLAWLWTAKSRHLA